MVEIHRASGRDAEAVVEPMQRYIASKHPREAHLLLLGGSPDMSQQPHDDFRFSTPTTRSVFSRLEFITSGRRAQSSTLKDRFRYTPTSAFKTYPWPQPTATERHAVASVCSALLARRSEICVERQIGLTKLYNEADDGAYTDLRDLHRDLDEAVAVAYGWPVSAAHDSQESNRLLLELNRAIAAGEVDYRPFD